MESNPEGFTSLSHIQGVYVLGVDRKTQIGLWKDEKKDNYIAHKFVGDFVYLMGN